MNAAVLQQRTLLLELLLANWTANVQRHAGRSTVLYKIGQHETAAVFLTASTDTLLPVAIVRTAAVRLATLPMDALTTLAVQILQ